MRSPGNSPSSAMAGAAAFAGFQLGGMRDRGRPTSSATGLAASSSSATASVDRLLLRDDESDPAAYPGEGDGPEYLLNADRSPRLLGTNGEEGGAILLWTAGELSVRSAKRLDAPGVPTDIRSGVRG